MVPTVHRSPFGRPWLHAPFRWRGRRRPAAPILVDLSHTLVEQFSRSSGSEGVEAVDPPASKHIKSIADVATQVTVWGGGPAAPSRRSGSAVASSKS
eukprot:356865-Chlamydomonas_euryale.AAC.2